VSLAGVLTVLGVLCEFTGIVLVEWPYFVPYVERTKRGAARLSAAARRAWRRLRRRPEHLVLHAERMAATGGMGDDVLALVSVGDDAPLEQKLSFLLRQVDALQRRLGEVENAVRVMPDRWRAELNAAVDELRAYVASEIERARDEYSRLRRLGIVFIAAGTILLAWASAV
jgi:hypothetical protein